jgi:hypothetical protein
VKYLILIRSNRKSREVWAAIPAAQRAEGLALFEALDPDLAASGEMIVAQALADQSTATLVSVRERRTIATDGPFAEVKYQLAGFFLVECDTLEPAVEIAARVPEAAVRVVEVRPIMDLGGFEW